MWLNHLTPLFDELDSVVARVATLVASIGGVLLAVRSLIQNLHASQAVASTEQTFTAVDFGSGGPVTQSEAKKTTAMALMATAPALFRASPARADKLIEAKVAKLKRASQVPAEPGE